jgi:hypothetical protein
MDLSCGSLTKSSWEYVNFSQSTGIFLPAVEIDIYYAVLVFPSEFANLHIITPLF